MHKNLVLFPWDPTFIQSRWIFSVFDIAKIWNLRISTPLRSTSRLTCMSSRFLRWMRFLWFRFLREHSQRLLLWPVADQQFPSSGYLLLIVGFESLLRSASHSVFSVEIIELWQQLQLRWPVMESSAQKISSPSSEIVCLHLKGHHIFRDIDKKCVEACAVAWKLRLTSSIPNSPDNFHDGPTTLSEDRLGFLKDAFIIKLENIRNSLKLFRATSNIFQTLKHFFRILESSASTLSEEIHISTTVLRKCFRILRHETCRYYR